MKLLATNGRVIVSAIRGEVTINARTSGKLPVPFVPSLFGLS